MEILTDLSVAHNPTMHSNGNLVQEYERTFEKCQKTEIIQPMF